MTRKILKTSIMENEVKSNQEELQELQAELEGLRARIATLEKNEQRLSSLTTISAIITQSMEFRDVLNLTADNIMGVMDADAILVFLLDEETDELVLELYKGVSANFVAETKRIKVGEGFNGTVAARGEPLVIEDVATSPLLSVQAVILEGFRSQLIVPLKSKAKVIGTLCVAKRRPAKFDQDDMELLNSIGNHIGANMENARLYRDMKRALSQLQQSEERYRDLFENATDAIWVHDFDNKTLAVNKACEKVTGYSSEELMSMSMSICQLLSPSGKSRVFEIEDKLIRDDAVDPRLEAELTTKEGAKAIIEVTTSLIAHEGHPIGFQHAARDVTENREMQESLRYYLQHVTQAQEEERKRIARELHDETLQNLIVISRQLEKITSSDALWEESHEVVRGLKKQIEKAVHEIRRFSNDLRPSVLDDLGLLPALELLADDLETNGINTIFSVSGVAKRLRPEVETMLFRIAQEAVRNIWRHAKASKAELSVKFNHGTLRMSITDNGIGFKLPRRSGELATLGKLGVVGMQERAKFLGGTLILKSEPNGGTQILVDIRV